MSDSRIDLLRRGGGEAMRSGVAEGIVSKRGKWAQFDALGGVRVASEESEGEGESVHLVTFCTIPKGSQRARPHHCINMLCTFLGRVKLQKWRTALWWNPERVGRMSGTYLGSKASLGYRLGACYSIRCEGRARCRHLRYRWFHHLLNDIALRREVFSKRV